MKTRPRQYAPYYIYPFHPRRNSRLRFAFATLRRIMALDTQTSGTPVPRKKKTKPTPTPPAEKPPGIRKVILFVETSRAFGRDLLYGIARFCRTHQRWSFCRETGGLEHSLDLIKDWDADGIITRDLSQKDALASLGLPSVIVVHRRDDAGQIPRVVTNSQAIAQTAVDHFLDRGFRRFAFCGFDDMPWSAERANAFQQILAALGHHVHLYRQPRALRKRSWKAEQNVLADWLRSLPKPIAVLACNDDRAQHASEACKAAQIDVPDDVAILGVDNDELVCELADPPLSSIALNTELAGYQTAELLDRLMNGEPMAAQDILVNPSHIVPRQSTDILALEDREIADAVRFIRQNARLPLQVDDVARAAGLSRRILERRFRIALHRSVVEEIRRVRTRRIADLLIETDLSIAQIADALEFADRQHIARYFRQETGLSLLEFRKRFAKRHTGRPEKHH